MSYGVLTPLGRQLRAVLTNLSTPPRSVLRSKRCIATAPAEGDQVHKLEAPAHLSATNLPTERQGHTIGLLDRAASAVPEESGNLGHDHVDQSTISRSTKLAHGIKRISLEHTQASSKGGSTRLRAAANRNASEGVHRMGCDIDSIAHSSTVRQRRRHENESAEDAQIQRGSTLSSTRRLSKALVDAGKVALVPQRVRRHNAVSKRTSTSPKAKQPRVVASLMQIIGRFIDHRNSSGSESSVEVVDSFKLDEWETAWLKRNGKNMSDVATLADIACEEVPLKLVQLIEDRLQENGQQGLPYDVLVYVLGRPYFTAGALAALIDQCWQILESQPNNFLYWNTTTAFVTAKLLLRHCRTVAPSMIPNVTSLFLKIIRSQQSQHDTDSIKYRDQITRRMNSMMILIAQPVAVEPFKSEAIQQEALVQLLTFMEQHDPQVQVNRKGYQAVTTLQLMQRKSENDSIWTELKALSWPPWKQERTAVDREITVQEHGRSRAAQTLDTMRLVGFPPRQWDTVARVYAGWDTDKTPTIQTRHVMQRIRRGKSRAESAIWVARMATTRTVQEAWACYLAYEGTHPIPSSAVCRAFFEKLHLHEFHPHIEARRLRSDASSYKLLPGDSREVVPLSPFSHEQTYTATPPPTLQLFYEYLIARDITVGAHCLGFLLANAPSRSAGLRFLLTVSKKHPSYEILTRWNPELDIRKIPSSLFAGAIQFLCRFTKRTMLTGSAGGNDHAGLSGLSISTYDNVQQDLNLHHSLVWAIKLLELRQPTFSPPWNSVLLALARSAPSFIHGALQHGPPVAFVLLDTNLEWCHGTIVTFDFARTILRMMDKIHLELDQNGLQALCSCVENDTVGSWKILRDAEVTNTDPHIDQMNHFLAIRSASSLHSSLHTDELIPRFRLFITGQTTHPLHESTSSRPPLAIPNPALLHAYIRALGWNAAYPAMLELVHWMRQHVDSLAARRGRDRNGNAKMRRAIVALRVFLEQRHVFLESAASSPRQSVDDERVREQVARLQRPAPRELVDEIRALVDDPECDWGGWATDEELQIYCSDHRFVWFARKGAKDGDVEASY